MSKPKKVTLLLVALLTGLLMASTAISAEAGTGGQAAGASGPAAGNLTR